MICFVGVIKIILMSILMKNLCKISRHLTKKSNCINFKNQNQIETKKIRT